MKHRTPIWRLAAHGGAAIFTAVALVTGTQAAVSGAQASVTGPPTVRSPYSPAYQHVGGLRLEGKKC
jgi:hypothetical protein